MGVELSLLERCERLSSSGVMVVVEGASPSLIRPRGLVLFGVGVAAAAAADGGGGTSSLAAEFKQRASLKLVVGLGLRRVQRGRGGEELPLRKEVVGGMKELAVAAVLKVGGGREGRVWIRLSGMILEPGICCCQMGV